MLTSMKRIILALAGFLLYSNLFSQNEFKTYDNGLIYSKETMLKLSSIVDSLNLKYITCDIDKEFYSRSQTIGHIITLDTLNILQAKKDLENNISLESFLLKYPNSHIERNVLIIKSLYKNYREESVVNFSEVNLSSNYGFDIRKINQDKLYTKLVKNTWIFNYEEKTEYFGESLSAFYFPNEFESIMLNKKYGNKISYADCLIDTTTTKFKENTENAWVQLPPNWQYISTNRQIKLLDQMRSTRVIGNCSMDGRPREHAVNIALLSAETTNWGVFLKSHLDIMNDRFDRISDGSYAWAQRKTYIKEIEDLHINVNDLLIGISLRIENKAKNHYYGSIGRVGRAISESENREEFETTILSMIEDSELDNYNRVISYFLFISYNNYLENEDDQKENLIKLKKSIKSLPSYLSNKIDLREL